MKKTSSKLTFILAILFPFTLLAQSNITHIGTLGTSGDIPAYTESVDDKTPRITEATLPQNPSYNSITFTMKGGDGGWASAGSDCVAGGGLGAVVEFTLLIGNGPGQIPGGTTFRFFHGRVGETAFSSTGTTHKSGTTFRVL